MALNQRERKIAWVVGGLIGLYALFAFVLRPLYLDPVAALDKSIVVKRQQRQQEQELLANRSKVRAEWDKLIQSGLTTDPTQASTVVSESINRMIQQSRVRLVSFGFNPPLANTRSDFAEVPLSVQVNATSTNLMSLLYWMETSGLPIRVDNVNISANRPGQDDLNAEIKVAILLYSPRASSIRIASTQSATRPGGIAGARGGTGRSGGPEATQGRGQGTTPAAAAAPAQAVPAEAPKAAAGSAKTEEELIAEMKARRQREEAGVAGEVPAAANQTTTPTTQPNGGVR